MIPRSLLDEHGRVWNVSEKLPIGRGSQHLISEHYLVYVRGAITVRLPNTTGARMGHLSDEELLRILAGVLSDE